MTDVKSTEQTSAPAANGTDKETAKTTPPWTIRLQASDVVTVDDWIKKGLEAVMHAAEGKSRVRLVAGLDQQPLITWWLTTENKSVTDLVVLCEDRDKWATGIHALYCCSSDDKKRAYEHLDLAELKTIVGDATELTTNHFQSLFGSIGARFLPKYLRLLYDSDAAEQLKTEKHKCDVLLLAGGFWRKEDTSRFRIVLAEARSIECNAIVTLP